MYIFRNESDAPLNTAPSLIWLYYVIVLLTRHGEDSCVCLTSVVKQA